MRKISVLIAFALVSALATGARAEKEVLVTNDNSNPVPISQVGNAKVTVTNTPSVTVANTPSVKVVSMPAITVTSAAAIPNGFQAGAQILVAAGSTSGIVSFTVPGGTIAMIETVAVSLDAPAASTSAGIDLNSPDQIGQDNEIPLPLTASPSGSSALAQTRLYASSGSTVYFRVYTSGTAQVDGKVTFVGQLFPIPPVTQ